MTTPQQWAQVYDGRVTSVVTADLPPGGGWWPVEHVIPDHDPETHRPSGARYSVLADQVRATHTIVPIDPDVDDPAPDEPDVDAEPQPDPTPDFILDREQNNAQLAALDDTVQQLILTILFL